MIQILINNKPVQLLQPPPNNVYSLEVINRTMFNTPIVHTLTKPIQEWLYTITQSVTNIIIYNNIIIQKEDVNRPAHMPKEST